jgi:UDP-N-acetylmuramate--alanine ligase
MLSAVDLSGRPFHFIGIGGIGMSALAHILTQRQLPVSGSDVRATHITQKLQSLGAHIFWQQNAANLGYFLEGSSAPGSSSDAQAASPLPQVICSTAIRPTNPEYQAAVEMGCPIFHRSDVLAALIEEAPQSIAVAGTHGKTTTSSLIGYLFFRAKLDPTIVVGGEVAAWQGNARVGQSPYLVAEADESDGSLVKFHPQIGVITNIELDHPDHYATLEEVVRIFEQFTSHCRQLVLCLDCSTIRSKIMADSADANVSGANAPGADAFDSAWITYSLDANSQATYRAESIKYGSTETTAVIYERGDHLGHVSVSLLGEHNLSNALAAIAVGRMAGIPFDVIAAALSTFEGAQRRFEHRGEAQGICFIDDYAHHPSEVRATLSSAKLQITPNESGQARHRRVVAVFQPHRYSRIQTFLTEFSQAFGDADCVVVTDIYSAGETQPPDMSGASVAAAIAEHHPHVSYQETLVDVTDYLKANLASGDLVVFLGAGDLNRIIPDMLSHFQQQSVSDLTTEVALR